MNRLKRNFIKYLVLFAFWFRYRVTVKKLDILNKQTLPKPGGILFLPNHPAVFVDPVLIVIAADPKYDLRPMVVEYMFYTPFVHWVMKVLKAVPVPNFDISSNSMKRKKSKESFKQLITDLRKGDNFLIYPSGRVKYTNMEVIGGASGVHTILEQAPEANVVLVRIKGLWGSSFSRALTGKTPDMFKTIWQGIKHTLKNLIFFNPRREIIVEFEPAPDDFPWKGTKIQMNKWLENYYNRPDGMSAQKGRYPGESLILVPYSIWDKTPPQAHPPEVEIDSNISLDDIPLPIQQKVTKRIAEIMNIPEESVKPEMNLSTTLGMDSLDIAELVVFLQDEFDIETVPAVEITKVRKVMAIAARKISIAEDTEEEDKDLTKWHKQVPEGRAVLPPGKTFPEVFLKTCDKLKDAIACGDLRSGILTFDELKLRTLLVAEKIRKVPGKYVGIMLPASVGANLLVLACQMAGKVPLMVNWTAGPRHLEAVIKASGVKVVYTSWAFLDRLHHIELDGMEDLLVTVEDLRRTITLKDKLMAYWRSKQSVESILKTFGIDKQTEEDQAVLLFTSGTENLPKGVPLTHRNVLTNFRAGLNTMSISTNDILFGILPPFHSFGFYIGLLGLLGGFKTVYYPDPTDGKRLAKNFEKWKPTIICGAPTFIKGMLKSATPKQLESMRLCITGAEKAPPELKEMLSDIGKLSTFLEGYGITECSPVLTLTRPGKPLVGVGKPVDDVELKIVSIEEEKPLPIGERGLILARGPNVFRGYLGGMSVGSPFVVVGGKEWYRTGDLGYLDKEGNLTISGRLKRFIKIGGEMISLAALEDALLSLGAAKGWATTEEGPVLAITAKEIPNEKVKIILFSRFESTPDEVNKHLKKSGFSNLVKVSSVIHVPEFPLLGTGKINYRALDTLLQ